MSEAEHERTAAAEEAAAARSTAAYRAVLQRAVERCRTRTWVCWRYLVEPAEVYLEQAERHLELAAKHRAAAQALATRTSARSKVRIAIVAGRRISPSLGC